MTFYLQFALSLTSNHHRLFLDDHEHTEARTLRTFECESWKQARDQCTETLITEAEHERKSIANLADAHVQERELSLRISETRLLEPIEQSSSVEIEQSSDRFSRSRV